MLFNSLYFLMFFAVAAVVYFAVPQKFKWMLLLAVSLYFYMCWNPIHIIILMAVTLISYLTAVYINKDKAKGKKLCLGAGIVITLAFLLIYKYYGFFMDSVYDLLNTLHISYTEAGISLALPVGISFYTFKAVSYMIDVYRGKIYCKNVAKYLLYVSFFPQIASGPIERSTNLIPQFEKEHRFNSQTVESGLRLMLLGYFKKMVVADNLSGIVSKAFSSPESCTPFILFFVACLYSLQIFCDFSGYSDIAIGCTKVFGYDTMKNFDHPYFSKNIPEFWRRWHISLSSWFKDYLYIPLGGNRKGILRKYVNLMIVFLVSGLWHGSSWNFVFWGFLHGFYQIVSGLTVKLREKICNVIRINKCEKLHNAVKIIITFVLVTFAWIFFRADSIESGFKYISCMFTNSGGALNFAAILSGIKMMFSTKAALISFVAAMAPFLIFSFTDYFKPVSDIIDRRCTVFKIVFYALVTAYIVLFASTAVTDFIYIRF